LAERDQRLAELKRQVGNRGYHDEETNSKAGIKDQDDECNDRKLCCCDYTSCDNDNDDNKNATVI
jgi:hypothetical protein